MKKTLRIISFLILCLILCTLYIYGQTALYKKGELIVKLKKNLTRELLVNKISKIPGTNEQVTLERQISSDMNIWILSFNQKNIDTEKALYLLRQHQDIEVAQLNHLLTNRSTIPNDSKFNLQWQYINNGSSGGVVDADIDADDAWDITTGGVTANGDTIVLAVIDDGLDITHPDWGDNLWINRNEIPDNNIDDDGNGYKDDYDGWNFNSNNDDLTDGGWGGTHGSSVAGIVGAKGNNTTGVTGVNWNVKLMIVVGGGDEAEAVAAYSYVLKMRKLYESTNGVKGAYVVGTNASWGINYGQPADAPLWCAMYDSLGKYGILSCGATINGNKNVDQVGDLPTACPSSYLISVTNTKRNDQKETEAGYGTTHIDIGSPGSDTYTIEHTSWGTGYGDFGGTSGATPHVTGCIGLLYAAACPELLDIAENFPDSAAKLMRQFILGGVDPNTSLYGITVTGGRLNLKGALDSLMSFCSLIQNKLTVVTLDNLYACIGDTVNLSATVSKGVPPYIYKWSGGTIFSLDTLNTKAIVNQNTDFVITVIDSSGNSESDTLKATIYPEPNANFGFIISGFQYDFLNNSPNGKSYEWSFGDGDTSASTNPKHTYQDTGNFIVQLIVYGNCSNDTIYDTVNVQSNNNNFTLDVAASVDQLICMGDSIALSATTSNGIAPLSYLWMPDYNISSVSDSTPKVAPVTDTSYIVFIYDKNGNAGSDTVNINIKPATKSLFTYSIINKRVYCTNTSANASTYLWNLGDGYTSKLEDIEHSYLDSGSYQICLNATGDCNSDKFCDSISIVDSTIGIADILFYEKLNVFPNPAKDFVLLDVKNFKFKASNINIINTLGQTVSSWTVSNPEKIFENEIIKLDIKNLHLGTYFIKIEDADGNLIKGQKLIIR